MAEVRNKRVFITGGAGFIASHLIDRLIADNEVVLFDNLERNALQYTGWKDHPHLRFIQGDVLDADALNVAMRGADICVHAAAVAGIYSVGVNASKTMKVNMIGTYHALEAAVMNGVPKFLDFSTSEVYGPFVYRGKETDRTTLGPVGERRWVYAVSKLAGEHFAGTYAEESKLQVVSVRPFNVYGPRQVGEGAIREMVMRALADEDIIVYNDGTQIRSWCYVVDFVDGLYQAISRDFERHEVFNIGNPQATTTVLGLAETIIRLTGSNSKIVFKRHPGPEVEMRIPDIQKAMDLLDFRPLIKLEDGLLKTIQWYEVQSESRVAQ